MIPSIVFASNLESHETECYINGERAERVFTEGKRSGIRGPKWANKKRTFIVKMGTYGRNQTEGEVERWATIKGKDRRHFAPVLVHGKLPFVIINSRQHSYVNWLAMEYIHGKAGVQTRDYKTYKRLSKTVRRLTNRYNLYDLHDYNWILRHSIPVIIDYGG